MDQIQAVKEAVNWAGTQCRLAEILGTTQASVSAWINRFGRIGSSYALKVHQLTNGKISAYDLRPDLYPRDEVTIRRIKKS